MAKFVAKFFEWAGMPASESEACVTTTAEPEPQSPQPWQQQFSDHMLSSVNAASQLDEAETQFACMFGQRLGNTIDAMVGDSTAGSPGVQNMSISCFTKRAKQGSGHEVRKRSLRRARRRAAAQGQTTYKGRIVTSMDIGGPGELYTARHMSKSRRQSCKPCTVSLPSWPPASNSGHFQHHCMQKQGLTVLTLNIGGLSKEGYHELLTWLGTQTELWFGQDALVTVFSCNTNGIMVKLGQDCSDHRIRMEHERN